MCEGSGENHVIARNGKLHDFKGDVKFPFMCQVATQENYDLSGLDICNACSLFINILNTKFNPTNIAQFLTTICEENENFLMNLLGNICEPVANFGVDLIITAQKKYLNGFEICNLFHKCNFTESSMETNSCNSCKYLLNQIKLSVLEANAIDPIARKLPTLQNILPYFCQTFGFKCNNLNFLTILKSFFINQFDDSKQEMFCIAFKQCP